MDTVIKNGTIITATETYHADIGIEGGEDCAVGAGPGRGGDDRFWGQPPVVGRALRAFVTGQHRVEKAKPADEQQAFDEFDAKRRGASFDLGCQGEPWHFQRMKITSLK